MKKLNFSLLLGTKTLLMLLVLTISITSCNKSDAVNNAGNNGNNGGGTGGGGNVTNPNVPLLVSMTFKCDTIRVKALSSTVWTKLPSDPSDYYPRKFSYQGMTGDPGNKEETVKPNGQTETHYWYFPVTPTVSVVFRYHGVNYDGFTPTGNNGFILHRKDLALIGGQPVEAEYQEYYSGF